MVLERSHRWNYDEKEIEKQEKISIVILQKQMTAIVSCMSEQNKNTSTKHLTGSSLQNVEVKIDERKYIYWSLIGVELPIYTRKSLCTRNKYNSLEPCYIETPKTMNEISNITW